MREFCSCIVSGLLIFYRFISTVFDKTFMNKMIFKEMYSSIEIILAVCKLECSLCIL